MLAARHGAAHVYAVEQFQGLVTVATKTVHLNGFGDRITMLAKSSFDVCAEDLPLARDGRCDMMVSELLDFSLLGENVVPIIRDAFTRLLHPSAPCIPHSAQLFGQLIQSPSLETLRLRNAPIFKHCLPCQVHGLEPFKHVGAPQQLIDVVLTPPTSDTLSKTESEPLHAGSIQILNGNDTHGWCEFPLGEQRASSIDGLLVWWELQLLPDNHELVYSTDPAATTTQGFQDHWSQGVFVLPRLLCAENDHVTLRFELEDATNLIVEVAGQQSDPSTDLLGCALTLYGSVERAAMYGSQELMDYFACALRSSITAGSSVLDISNGNILGWLASRLEKGAGEGSKGATFGCPKRVVLFDEKAYISPATCPPKLPSPCSMSQCDCPGQQAVEVMAWKGADHGESWKPEWHLVDHLVGDCFAYQLRNRPVLAALNMLYLRTALDPVIAPSATFLPHHLHIRAALVHLPALAPCHAPVFSVCGLDHTPFAEAIRDDGKGRHLSLQPFPLWQYERHLVSQPVTLATLDMSLPLASFEPSVYHATICKWNRTQRSSDAMVIWVDAALDQDRPHDVLPGYPYTESDLQLLDEDGDSQLKIAPQVRQLGCHGPFWSKQLVRFLHPTEHCKVNPSIVDVELTLYHDRGTFTLTHSSRN
eukprot:m.171753 g.171753  ORF g.171753 m.171753 type:complete len:648 (+) comp16506_c0_seq2:232-2175(+)